MHVRLDGNEQLATIFFIHQVGTAYRENLVAAKAVSFTLAASEATRIPEQLLFQYDILSTGTERVGSFKLPFDPDSYDPTKDTAAKPFTCSLAELALLGGGLEQYHANTIDALRDISPISDNAGTISVARRVEGRMAGAMANAIRDHVTLTPLISPKPAHPFGFSNVKWFNAQ